ncbi:MAG: hypothetical protein VX519_00810 [Myxococcota bacterium]|nr:hypothetical protein [Myxococcota bacterium]
MPILSLLLLLTSGCSNKNDTSDTPIDIGGDSSAPDSGSEDTGPADIESITLTFTGALEQTLTFDQPACTHTASTHFRSFWRDSTDSHTFVIIAEVLGGLEGAGQYDHNTPGARIKLQEESGGGGAFFQTDTTASDTLNITLGHLDAAAGEAWGTYEFSAIQGESGGTSVTPLPIPIRCPSL